MSNSNAPFDIESKMPPDSSEAPNNSYQQVDRLGKSKISRLMLEFAIPSIIGLVVNGLYSIIDSIFLGHGVGKIGLAAATVSMPLLSIGIGLAMLIGAGGNALAALRFGEQKHKEAELVLGNTMILMVISCLLIAVVLFFYIDPLLVISGVTEAIWEPAKQFVLILGYGMILQFISMGLNNFIRTAGDPNRALYTMIAGMIVCVALNYLFVLVFGWGVVGSATATLIGQAVSSVLMLWYFLWSKFAPFKLRLINLRPNIAVCRRILALGSASFVLQIAMSVIGFFINNLLVQYGSIHPIGASGALATIGVIQRLGGLLFFPLLGIAIAAQPLWGYNYGACNYERVKKTTTTALIWSTAIGTALWIVIIVFARQLLSVFGISQELLDFSVFALIVQQFFFPFVGVQVIGSHYFQSTGQPLKSIFLSLTRQILYLLPLLYILPEWLPKLIPSLTRLDTLYFSFPISDIFAILTTTILLVREYRKINKNIRTVDEPQVDK